MTKEELAVLLDSLGIDEINEGIQNDNNANKFPRIVYFETEWDDLDASGDGYLTKVTYQLSFFSEIPRHEKLLLLRRKLKEYGLRPVFYHEYIEEGSFIHTACSIQVLEDVG